MVDDREKTVRRFLGLGGILMMQPHASDGMELLHKNASQSSVMVNYKKKYMNMFILFLISCNLLNKTK